MERFSQRESVLLGYSPQRSFMNEHSSSSPKPTAAGGNSDIDFDDVFGGPPRRSSMHETRCSYSPSEVTENDGFRGDDETVASRNSWNGVREKPVFGEEGMNRRRYPSENFFDDIFRGNGSLSSSPRICDRDPYSSSSPASRVLSPARPLPPKAEPSGISIHAEFSLPAKFTKGMELPTFGLAPRSPYKSKDGTSNGINHHSSSLFRSSSLNLSHEEGNDTRSSYRQSILSREFSLSNKDADTETVGDSKMESNSSEVLTSGNLFHFSIYKWASKRVPFDMPLREVNRSKSKENNDADRCSSSDGWVGGEKELPTETLHDTKLHLNVGVLADSESFRIEHNKQNDTAPPDTSTENRVETWPTADPGDATSENTGEETKSHSQSEIGLHNELEKVSVVAEEAHKPELKPLCSLFYNDHYERSNEEMNKNASEKESKVKCTKKSSVVPDFSKNKKKQDVKRDCGEVGKGGLQGSPMNSKDLWKTGVRGKVKEFVKIFNQEGLSKSKINVDPQSKSSRWKGTGNSKPEKDANFSKIAPDGKIHKSTEHEKKSFPDTPIMVNGNLAHSEKQQAATNTTNRMSNGTPEWKDSSSTESGGTGSKETGNIDKSLQGNSLVNQVTKDDNKLRKLGNDPQEFQAIDVQIRKWSNGKEGNIRSLLSTLQYILWPASGWKPVPLVDIIEGNAVKRSYQKALLCLHPDKLQQKGATCQQKYIAEKVFDILQEAWTHFNSLGSL
ncbi:hypothetical protein AB3S75_013851 [Citrus x aurantiifolia]